MLREIAELKGCLARGVVVFVGWSSCSQAAVLTFDISGLSNFQDVPQGYGDQISAATVGSFSYGLDEGLTPNVSVSYGDSDPSLWANDYGSLSNVLFENTDSTGVLTVTISAEPGFEAVLHGFDLSAYTPAFSSAPTIDLVEVTSASGSLFSQANAVISETTFSAFDFGPTLQAEELTIRIDARNLGNLNDDIAIDNIVFSQVAVPEPSASACLMLVGFLSFVRRRL